MITSIVIMCLGFFLYQLKEFSVWSVANKDIPLQNYFDRIANVKILTSAVSLVLLWLMRDDVKSIFSVSEDNGFFYCVIGYFNSSVLQSALGFMNKKFTKNINQEP